MADLLQERTIVLTGAGGELGRAHICALVKAGARVYASDTPAGWGKDGQAMLRDVLAADGDGEHLVLAEHDCETALGADALWDSALRKFGTLHGLVNAGGTTRDRTLAKMSDEEWDNVFASCLDAAFYPTRTAARYWRGLWQAGSGVESCVVNRSSTSAMPGQPGQANYAAAMSGAATFTIVAAREGARYGMRANVLCGPFDAAALQAAAGRGVDQRSLNGGWQLSPAILSPALVALLRADCTLTGQVIFVGQGKVRTLEPWAILSEVPTSENVGADEMVQRLARLDLRRDQW
jgi:NAD(P)-dependent dehydrogenase (short-subunit alcohol dehydrogenase family)